MKKIITLLLLLSSLLSAQEVEHFYRLEGFMDLKGTLKLIENSDYVIREMYKLYLRAEAIDNRYVEKELSGDETLQANMEMDSVITLVQEFSSSKLPYGVDSLYNVGHAGLLSYCTNAKAAFSQKATKANDSSVMDTKIKKLIGERHFITSIIAMKERSESRYILSTQMAMQYFLPPEQRVISRFGTLEKIRPEHEGYHKKLNSLFKESFLKTDRSRYGFAIVVATYKGLVKDIYTESFTVKDAPTGEMDIRISLTKEGKVKECKILNSEVKDSVFLNKLDSLIEEEWSFGYGPEKTYQFRYRVYETMHRKMNVEPSDASPFGKGGFAAGIGNLPPLPRKKSEIMKVVTSHVPDLKIVFNVYRETYPNLTGKVTLKISINDDGTVSNCSKVSSNTGNDSFDNNLMKLIGKWDFGRGKATTITYPFVFQL